MIQKNKKIFNLNEIDSVFFNRKKTLENIFMDKSNKLTIFDVGANEGQSLIEFKKWFKESYVHCFEPDKETSKILRNNNFKNVIYNQVGVGAKKEVKTFYSYSLSSINSFLQIDTNSNVFNEKVHQKVNNALNKDEQKSKINITTLDKYTKKNKIGYIDILKVDVQGFEKQVLIGSKKLIKKHNIGVIIIEITFDEIYGKGSSFYDIESKLIPHGYKLWDISHIYKDLTKNRTNWVDAIYVNKEIYKNL